MSYAGVRRLTPTYRSLIELPIQTQALQQLAGDFFNRGVGRGEARNILAAIELFSSIDFKAALFG